MYDYYLFFRELLREISSELEHSDYRILTAPRSPTIRYPPATPLVSPFDEFPSYTLPIQKRDFDSKKATWFPKKLYFEFKDLLTRMGDDDWLVLKACAHMLSGGWTDQNQTTTFLQMCSNLGDNSDLKKLIVDKLYLGVYTVRNKDGIRFALTRHLPYMKCSSQEFAHWWRDNRPTTETAFVEYVIKVAMEAIEHNVYHWDIRTSNLLFDKRRSASIFSTGTQSGKFRTWTLRSDIPRLLRSWKKIYIG